MAILEQRVVKARILQMISVNSSQKVASLVRGGRFELVLFVIGQQGRRASSEGLVDRGCGCRGLPSARYIRFT